MPVTITNNTKDVERKLQTVNEVGLAKMAIDLLRTSKVLIPVDTGNLARERTNIEYLSKTKINVVSATPYARRQYFENKNKDRWFEKAAQDIFNNPERYFR